MKGLQEKTPAPFHQSLRNGGAQCLDFQTPLVSKNVRHHSCHWQEFWPKTPYHGMSVHRLWVFGQLLFACSQITILQVRWSPTSHCLSAFCFACRRTSHGKKYRRTYLHTVRCTCVFPGTHDLGRIGNPFTFWPEQDLMLTRSWGVRLHFKTILDGGTLVNFLPRAAITTRRSATYMQPITNVAIWNRRGCSRRRSTGFPCCSLCASSLLLARNVWNTFCATGWKSHRQPSLALGYRRKQVSNLSVAMREVHWGSIQEFLGSIQECNSFYSYSGKAWCGISADTSQPRLQKAR